MVAGIWKDTHAALEAVVQSVTCADFRGVRARNAEGPDKGKRLVGSLLSWAQYGEAGASMDSKHFFRKQEEKIDPLALRPRDAAAALGISPSTLERLTRAGEIPHVKINRLVLYRVESLRQWIKDRESAEHPPLPQKAQPTRPAVQTHQAPVPRAASKRRSVKRKKPVSAPEPIAVQGRAKTVFDRSRSDVESAERTSRFSQFLKSVGIAPSKLPPLTNGELMRAAGVDLVQWHGWQYLGRALSDEAMERLTHHLQRLASSPKPR